MEEGEEQEYEMIQKTVQCVQSPFSCVMLRLMMMRGRQSSFDNCNLTIVIRQSQFDNHSCNLISTLKVILSLGHVTIGV